MLKHAGHGSLMANIHSLLIFIKNELFIQFIDRIVREVNACILDVIELGFNVLFCGESDESFGVDVEP